MVVDLIVVGLGRMPIDNRCQKYDPYEYSPCVPCTTDSPTVSQLSVEIYISQASDHAAHHLCVHVPCIQDKTLIARMKLLVELLDMMMNGALGYVWFL